MHNISVNGSDTWILQEKVVYNFQQQSSLTRRHNRCTTLSEQEPPGIIILSLWPQASPEQIQHYTSGYAYLYPTAKVVLLHNHIPPFSDDAIYDSALDLIDAQQYSKRQQTVLLHLFGTSGAAGACKLLRRYSMRTAGPLNVGAVVADSEPASSLTSLLTSSQPISTTFFNVLAAFWTSLQVLILFWQHMDNPIQVHQDLKDPSLLPKEARKCFVFAQRGLMLTWTRRRLSTMPSNYFTHDEPCSPNIENNEEEHERREVSIRRSSIGQRGRWSGDQERYWSGIESVWSGR